MTLALELESGGLSQMILVESGGLEIFLANIQKVPFGARWYIGHWCAFSAVQVEAGVAAW